MRLVSAWPFILFGLAFSAMVCLHFLLAYRAWRATREETSTNIDPDYVRVEDYFARSFRQKVDNWFQLPSRAAAPDGTRTITKGSELIRISYEAEFPPQSTSEDIQIVQGDFRCRAGCVFHREICVHGDAFIGPGTRMQAIAVDGNLTLDAGVRVARWADSTGDMEIGAHSIVKARVTSGQSVYLHEGVQVQSVFAPAVRSLQKQSGMSSTVGNPPAPEMELPGQGTDAGRTGKRGGVEWKKFSRLSPECWLYDGDLNPDVPCRVTTKLIVKGKCVLAPGSVLEGDLKADGRIVIGEGSVCKGNVIAGGEIRFAPGSRFLGVVHAGKTIRLCRGVVGGASGAKVAAYAADTLWLDEDVLVHGKLASADRVVVTEQAVRRSK